MCNLKSNKTLKEMLEYKKELDSFSKEAIELILFPSNIYLPFFFDVPYKIGSQNISIHQSGSYTGEVLASQLKSLRVSYVLVNHFEAQETFNEVLAKIKNATKEKIHVVLCFGEKNRQTMDETIVEIKKEIKKIFTKLTLEERENIFLAYEPCWAINNQYDINTNVINNIARKLKNEIATTYKITLPILYGGGITTKNIKELAKLDNIDGYLLGNCANNPLNICKVLDIL